MAEKKNPAPKEAGGGKEAPCQVMFVLEDKALTGTSAHFSDKGMLVSCQQPATLNTKLRLTLTFTGLKNPVEVQGEVVWANVHGSVDTLTPRGMGVKFVGLDRDAERLLSDMASQHNASGTMFACYYA